jgi:predicted dehydrogenase
LDIIGEDPLEVSAVGINVLKRDTKFYDAAYLSLKFSNSVKAFIKVGWLGLAKRRNLTIAGTKGIIMFDDLAEKKLKYAKLKDLSFKYPSYSKSAPLKIQLEEFIKCIKQGRTPQTDFDQAFRTTRVIHFSEQSILKKGKTVKIPAYGL